MPTHHTNDSESSSPRTLPTPRAQNGEDRNNKIWARDPKKPQNLENALAVTLPTPKARDAQAEGYEAGLRRSSPQVGTIVKGLVEGDERVLLRSPKVSEGQGGALGEAEARRRGNTVGVRDQVMDLVASQGMRVSRSELNTLFPTPTTRDYKDGSQPHQRDGIVQTDTVARAVFNSGEVLLGTPRATAANSSAKEVKLGAPKARIEDQVKLFPTLRASDGYERRNQKTMDRIAKEGGDMTMTTLARTTTEWGKFGPAIRLWEQYLGREAPAPTNPDGKEGNHRLSSKFTEWMMGLPEGWITDVGLKRNEELKLAGNGVVPQQAELALKILLENTPPPLGLNLTKLPTPTVSDTYTDNLKSTQQKEGSMHSVTLAQISKRI